MVVDNTLVTGESALLCTMCVMESYYYKCHSANPLIPAISDHCDNTQTQPKYCGQLTSESGDQVTCERDNWAAEGARVTPTLTQTSHADNLLLLSSLARLLCFTQAVRRPAESR